MDFDKIVFCVGLTFFAMHEMDAVRCKEWRIFPGLNSLNDKWGYLVFMSAHIPIFFYIFCSLLSADSSHRFITGFHVFLILHLVLHLLYLKHKKNEFKDFISWTLIVGGAVCGIVGLVLEAAST